MVRRTKCHSSYRKIDDLLCMQPSNDYVVNTTRTGKLSHLTKGQTVLNLCQEVTLISTTASIQQCPTQDHATTVRRQACLENNPRSSKEEQRAQTRQH